MLELVGPNSKCITNLVKTTKTPKPHAPPTKDVLDLFFNFLIIIVILQGLVRDIQQ